MSSPLARGLFDRAIAQSAYMISTPELKQARHGAPAAEAAGAALARTLQAPIHVALANETQHRKAVAIRKTQIQHDRIERRAFQRREGVLDPPDDFDRPAAGAEPDLEAVGENGIIFYGEQSHAA